MKNLCLLCMSAGLVGLAITPPADAIPISNSDALFTATEDRSSCLPWYSNAEWGETFAWDGTSWRDVTHWDEPARAGFRSLRFLVSDRGSLTGPGHSNIAAVPDSGGSTAALLLGALLGIVILRRHTIHAPGTTR